MHSTLSASAILKGKQAGYVVTVVLLVLLPFVLGAPANEESFKQQLASGLLRGDDLWTSLNQGKPYGYGYHMRRPWIPGYIQKRFDSLGGDSFGQQKRNFDEIDSNGFGSFAKRNFDEIDRVGGLGFQKKRNFDEIDRSGFGSFA